MKKTIILAIAVLFFSAHFGKDAYALGISQRDGAGGYQPENAQFLILPVQFSNFYYDKTRTVASPVGYHGVKYDQLDSAIASVFQEVGLQVYPILQFIEDAKMKEESNGRAVGQLYQDFVQVLNDSVSVAWPLLDKSKKFYLGRQFGNTLKRLPIDLTNIYFVVPLGHEFENEKHEVFGFLGVAVVDKEAEIITAAAVRYDPTKYSHAQLEDGFKKLVGRCAKKLQKEKPPVSHDPRVPELKKDSVKSTEQSKKST